MDKKIIENEQKIFENDKIQIIDIDGKYRIYIKNGSFNDVMSSIPISTRGMEKLLFFLNIKDLPEINNIPMINMCLGQLVNMEYLSNELKQKIREELNLISDKPESETNNK